MNLQAVLVAVIAIFAIASVGLASNSMSALNDDPSDIIDTSFIPTATEETKGSEFQDNLEQSIPGADEMKNVRDQVSPAIQKRLETPISPDPKSQQTAEGPGCTTVFDCPLEWLQQKWMLILAVLLILLAIAAIYLYIRRKYGGILELFRDEEVQEEDARIGFKQVDMSNDVYRAWAEMVAEIDLENPKSKTPEEFANAAISEGMNEEDVMELTDIFEQVLYGGKDVTNEHESRARRAIERIRATKKQANPE